MYYNNSVNIKPKGGVMTNTRKAVSVGIMNILKSVMTHRAKQLQHAITAGEEAKKQENLLEKQIDSLNEYVAANRHDRVEVRETESEIAEYEQRLSDVRSRIYAGQSAQNQLRWVDKFNVTHREFVYGPKIRELQSEIYQIEDKMDSLDRRMFNCEINMDEYERGADVFLQSQSELEYYRNEYDALSCQLSALKQELLMLNK